MRITTARFALVAAAALALSAHAEPPGWRAVDALQLDVAGVKLGMGYDQALSALGDHFKLSTAEREQLKASTSIAYGEITKKDQPTSVRFTKDGNTVVVSFVERVPSDQTEKVRVSKVSLSIPSSKGNADSMRQSARDKYGEPSDPRRKSLLVWCAHYNQIAQCDPAKPKLSLAMTSLSLSDPTAEKAVNAYLQNSKATKPAL